MEEIWKVIEINVDFEYTNKTRYEVSNLGRIRSFNSTAQGRLLKGGIREGYHTLAIKLFKVREPEKEAEFQAYKEELYQLRKRRKELISQKDYPPKIRRIEQRIAKKDQQLKKRLKSDFKRRTVNMTFLTHRLVATYFLPQPKPDETLISHLDYNKLNNHLDNLKWMTPDDNRQHQHKSPYVIAEKRQRKYVLKYNPRKNAWKLTSTQVIRIKKQLHRKRPIKLIAKEFGVSETHIRRINRGENWAHIKIPNSAEN